jgi:hypothetical protein
MKTTGPAGAKAVLLILICLFFQTAWALAEPARESNAGRQPQLRTSRPEGPAEQDLPPGLPRITFPQDPAQVTIPPTQANPVSGPQFALLPETVRSGEPVTIAYADIFTGPGSKDFRAVLINSRGTRVLLAPFFTYSSEGAGREILAAVLGIPSTAEPGPFIIRVEATNENII